MLQNMGHTQQFNEYIVKGFVMNDERLNNPPVWTLGRPRQHIEN